MKTPKKKKARKRKPRLPLEALKRIGSRPQTTKKGNKGYDRKRAKEEEAKLNREKSKGAGYSRNPLIFK